MCFVYLFAVPDRKNLDLKQFLSVKYVHMYICKVHDLSNFTQKELF
jgi:hypothetical protein